MKQAIASVRPGGHVGALHGVGLNGQDLFFRHVRLHGGPAPVRAYLPEPVDLVLRRKMEPSKVFDLELGFKPSRRVASVVSPRPA